MVFLDKPGQGRPTEFPVSQAQFVFGDNPTRAAGHAEAATYLLKMSVEPDPHPGSIVGEQDPDKKYLSPDPESGLAGLSGMGPDIGLD